ncbi:nucleotidyltransferase family protein [Rubrivirga sp. S365]|uniref:Nucleotidyltransferase family protein n=1 Tax=Rubrivirga litoralis TaxID=3075598 RepID=A0ABU3BLL0_9BACT|nr:MULTISPECIES: nucleotidyltransferase family protein [unclassified Rubrivirga]MDT0630125.1 nucleotidyltransferase family protein [Rubrivirga sp. F394]MDT7855635.1 nucleotidyltransferase family protein [Rubrivirga sp. S365]
MPAPPTTDAVRARLAALLPELRERYGVRALAIFGSYARGEQTAESDLDVLVEFDRTPSLYAFVGLGLDMEEAMGLKVDLATRPVRDVRFESAVERDLVRV